MKLVVFLAFLQIGVYVSSDSCSPGTYNKHERPSAGVAPTNISLKVYVRNVNSIDESKFTYNLDYILYYWYNDPRLSTNCSTPEFLKNVRKVNDIWFPNLGLINCHSSKEVANSEKVTIEPNGDVFAHKRMTTQCYCIMNLHAFPMDTQHCPFRLESYIYSMRDITLHWNTPAIQFEEGLEVIGYVQGKSVPKKFTMAYSYGTWEVMEASLVFHRQFLYYIYRVYVPTMLLMIFNFVSYWIPYTAMPARVTLIITTFLTLTFILQHVTAQTAKATTTTSLQIFLIFSVVLVVVAVMEFMVVMFFSKKREKEKKEQQATQVTEETEKEEGRSNDFHSLDVAVVKEMNRQITTSEIETQTVEIGFNVELLDRVFRFLAPAIYIIFCIIYFAYFLQFNH